jgi:hypothetical protein
MNAIRRQRLAILVLTSGLVACATAGGLPAPGECNAAPDASRSQYIIGYGSLMQEESRKRTSPRAGPAHPVEIKGYRRGWFARPETVSFSTTFLGVRPDRDSHLNAVIYQVDAAELRATDKREASYCRESVASPDIKALEGNSFPAPDGQAWIYVNKPDRVGAPDSRYPIVQSYVDIFLSGCLEQEQRFGLPEFSRECLSTTSDWSEHWVNDRIHPRRPFVHQPRAGQIDNLLARQLPEYFSHIRIEGGS